MVEKKRYRVKFSSSTFLRTLSNCGRSYLDPVSNLNLPGTPRLKQKKVRLGYYIMMSPFQSSLLLCLGLICGHLYVQDAVVCSKILFCI